MEENCYILMNDISLSGSWTAIGEIALDEQAKAFCGTFMCGKAVRACT